VSVASEAPPGVDVAVEDPEDDDPTERVGVDGLTAEDRGRLRRAWFGAAVPMLLLSAWLITAGRWDFLQRQYFDDFFDAQTRAISSITIAVASASAPAPPYSSGMWGAWKSALRSAS